VLGTFVSLQHAYTSHGDRELGIDDLSRIVRRRLEDETFEQEGPQNSGLGRPSREDAVQLVDDRAARYGHFDEVAIVGLIENEWPERPHRNIFYPSSLLIALGWPSDKDRRAGAEARFLDLLGSASGRVRLSTVTLDDESLVEPATLVEEISRARLSTMVDADCPRTLMFDEERLGADPVDLKGIEPAVRPWAALRRSRSTPEADAFHGLTAGVAERSWSVTALETYLACPFKFFAQHVLRLREEVEDEEVMDPRREGQFVHDVFERFFSHWQAEGHEAITSANLGAARNLFAEVVEERLSSMPDAEAGLQRTRLLGSPAAAGLGDAVLRMEAERPVSVVGRLLEHRIDGPFAFETPDGPRAIGIRAKADRIDLLADGTFRLVDYKLGWPPNRARALQLPIYALCAEQHLNGHLGRQWRLGEAAYLAFKGPRRIVPLFSSPAERDEVIDDARARLVSTVDAIGRGEFPPRPDDVYRCETCSYATVCRKDYVGDV
jgi:RecB family exonuclease